jgi:hypothetical protein
LREVARLTPDVVLLDIQLPGLDGFAVAEQLHNVAPKERTAHGGVVLAGSVLRVGSPRAGTCTRTSPARAAPHCPNRGRAIRRG